jgi:hypothetical protein
MIRYDVPTAMTVDFQTSDQGSYGFVLLEVKLADGTFLSDVNLDAYLTLKDDIQDHINNLSWDGVVGESHGGMATLVVPDDFDEEEATEHAYMVDLVSLIDGFNFERCGVCGNDVDKHTFGPDPLGKPHAFCLEGE